jgi:catechol 2,3-dioxygenase-like lactoylglutathione lyase family enzyme
MTYDGAGFKRANLVVADLERSLVIYRDILGLAVDFIKNSLPDSYSYPVFRFPAAARLRFATLSAGSQQQRTLALTEVSGVTLPSPPVPRLSAIVLHCRALDAALARLADTDGVELIPEQVLLTQDGRRGREAAFIDPDGHVVVLYRIDGD